MDLPNRDGTPIDPVPFFVVTAVAFATCYSYGPVYFVELGFRLVTGVVLSTVAFLGATAAGYYRLVWTGQPAARRAEVSPGSRLWRLVLLMLVGLGLVVLLALPLVL